MKITQEVSHKIIEKMEEEYELYAEFKYDPTEEGERKQYKPRVKRYKGRSKRR